MRSLFAALIACLLISGCAGFTERLKCGPNGTVDWDPNPQFPPPHCNGGK